MNGDSNVNTHHSVIELNDSVQNNETQKSMPTSPSQVKLFSCLLL